jgi:hypothetical protein
MSAARSARHRTDHLIEVAGGLHENPELQSKLAEYICIVAAGSVEQSVVEILSRYAELRSDERTRRFVQSKLRRFTNPKTSRIYELLAGFDTDWSKALRQQIDGAPAEQLDSLVALRNSVAHGHEKPVGVTLGRVKEYWKSACRVIQVLEECCNGHR